MSVSFLFSLKFFWRVSVTSSRAANFYRETDKDGLTGTKKFAYENCRQTEFNLNIAKQLPPKWRRRVKIVRFEDLSANPFKVLPDLLQVFHKNNEEPLFPLYSKPT